MQNILARAAKAATVSTRTDGFSGAGSGRRSAPLPKKSRAQQALEDLIVQVEIFLQYSLQAKAIERLERLAQLIPWRRRQKRTAAGAVRTRQLVAQRCVAQACSFAARRRLHPNFGCSSWTATTRTPLAPTAEETHRDLAAIAEINRLMYRQATPREVLAATAAQVGKHLGVTRCLVSVGSNAEAAPLVAEYFAPGVTAAGSSMDHRNRPDCCIVAADALGGIASRRRERSESSRTGLGIRAGRDAHRQRDASSRGSAARRRLQACGNGSRTKSFFCRPWAISLCCR